MANGQTKKAAIALSQRLDDCRHKRNVCVIGTGYGDPETLTPRFKTRFAYNIFTFPHIQPADIAKIMREMLEESGGVTSCSDQFLTQLAQSVKYLPIREIDNFVEESKALAVVESGNPEAIITEQHVTCIFNQYKEPTWFEKVWKNRNRHFSNVVSPQAVSLYMAIGGLGLLAASQYKNTGLVLTTLGFCMTSLLRG